MKILATNTAGSHKLSQTKGLGIIGNARGTYKVH